MRKEEIKDENRNRRSTAFREEKIRDGFENP
jgi:hypothetical protein